MSTWPQCTMQYDGTFAGYLSCVGESFQRRVYPFYFLPPGSAQVSIYPLIEIKTDLSLAKAVYRALETWGSPEFRRLMAYSFLTCLPQRERGMYDLIYLAYYHALPQDPMDDRFLLLYRAVHNLRREAEHYKGFVRFTDYGGVLVGQITPKNRVLPLLRPHFCNRLPEEAFLLHDKTHREALFYANHRWALRPVDRLELDRPSQAEAQCQALWKRFYRTIAIPQRRNDALQQALLPKRYWADMTEMQEDLAQGNQKPPNPQA